MRVSILNLHCLNAIADDYETVDSVIDDVRRSSHGNVNADEIAACLVELVRDGLAEPCRFDEVTSRYVPLQAVPSGLQSTWFRITELGRRQLDADWVDE
ncbi:MAG: hypothetical protein ACKOSQ_02630 [Planctomycetaceae bacterium]